jgi:hypothetical protein
MRTCRTLTSTLVVESGAWAGTVSGRARRIRHTGSDSSSDFKGFTMLQSIGLLRLSATFDRQGDRRDRLRNS